MASEGANDRSSDSLRVHAALKAVGQGDESVVGNDASDAQAFAEGINSLHEILRCRGVVAAQE